MSNSRRLTIGQNIDSGESGGGSINTSNYMTILALENGLTASLSTNACKYCIDGDGNWIDLPSGTTTQAINQGQTLSFKGNLTPNASYGIGTFTINKQCNLEGNCMSMLFGDDAVSINSLSGKEYAFRSLFSRCTTIMQVSETFLPATTLALSCYAYMFQYCSSLTTAPALPAATLANHCYYAMFYYCSNLNYIKMLATDISASNCLTGWVGYVPSTGTFVKNPAMTSLPTGSAGIPSGWTVVDDGDSVNLITFKIDDTEYQAEEGMTWEEWVNSEYNVDEVYILNNGNVIYGLSFIVDASTLSVSSSDVIKNINYYTFEDSSLGPT